MKQPTLLALVRHGESQWIAEGRFQGRGDPPLSDAGMRQASAVGVRLADPEAPPGIPVPPSSPTAIWHSPLLRASQTAAAIHEAREADAPMRPLENLQELSQGEWEGLTHDEVRERYPEQLAAWRENPLQNHAPGGESLQDAKVRARQASAMILGEGANATARAAVVGTGSSGPPADTPAEPVLGYERTFRVSTRPDWSIVVAHDGILRLLMLDLLGIEIDRFWSFPFALASVSVLDLNSGVVRLVAHNLEDRPARRGI